MLLLFLVAFGWFIKAYVTIDRVLAGRESLAAFIAMKPFTAAAAYLLVVATMGALAIPTVALLTVAGGALFGWPAGAILALCGKVVGGSFFFGVARNLGGRPSDTRLPRLVTEFRQNAFNYIVFLRLVPLVPFWLVNLAASLADVSWPCFIAATLVGGAPMAIALALVGSRVAVALSEQVQAYASCQEHAVARCNLTVSATGLLSPGVILAFALLACLALLPRVARLWPRAKP